MNNTSDSPSTREDSTAHQGKEFGTHFIVEFVDCAPERLASVDDTQKIMAEAVQKSRSKMVGSCFHQFEPQGASGVVLIKWSHFSVHTWPEERYVAADIFTCGEEMDPYAAIEIMKEGFGAREARYQEIRRGF